jgi:hypothetical protein
MENCETFRGCLWNFPKLICLWLFKVETSDDILVYFPENNFFDKNQLLREESSHKVNVALMTYRSDDFVYNMIVLCLSVLNGCKTALHSYLFVDSIRNNVNARLYWQTNGSIPADLTIALHWMSDKLHSKQKRNFTEPQKKVP